MSELFGVSPGRPIGPRGTARDVLAYIGAHLDDREFCRTPFPLNDRAGYLAEFVMPIDLSALEADRMAAFIRAWVVA